LLGCLAFFSIAMAQERPITEGSAVLVAFPFNKGERYNFVVFEQISGKRKCFDKNGTTPVVVDPLLLNFNWVGSCRRHGLEGVGLKINGKDESLQFGFVVRKVGNEIQMNSFRIVNRRMDLSTKKLIARTRGFVAGTMMELKLEPGFSLSRKQLSAKDTHYIFINFQGRWKET